MNRSKFLSRDEIFFLSHELSSDLLIKKKLWEKLPLTEDDIADLWDLCSDARCFEFDEDGVPTKKGLFIENLIDKLYDMGEHYDPQKQYKNQNLGEFDPKTGAQLKPANPKYRIDP